VTTILILEPSTSGYELLPNAHALGLKTIVFSADTDERIIPNPYRKYIDKLIQVDTNDFVVVAREALKLQKEWRISAVVPGFEIYVAHAAKLSQLLAVPGVSSETGDALRNKGKMREKLKKAGVPIPQFFIVKSEEEIHALINEMIFPCVIKPIDQSGSVHVSRVNNPEELLHAYSTMCHDTWTEMGKGIGSVAIIEEYIKGQEFSVEGYVDACGIHIVSVTEKILANEPFFVEMGHIVQAEIAPELHATITQYVRDVINAVEMRVGVFHCELRIKEFQPILMEISGRLAGDKICDLIYLATGVNFYQTMLRCYLGEIVPPSYQTMNRYAAIQYFSCEGKSFYEKYSGEDELRAMPGFHDFKISIPAGQVIPPLTSFQGRVGYCILTADFYSDLKIRMQKAKQLIEFI
jgi:biotin carboxylase